MTQKERVNQLWLMQFEETWNELWDFYTSEWKAFFKEMFLAFLNEDKTSMVHMQIKDSLLNPNEDFAQFIRDNVCYTIIERMCGKLDHTFFVTCCRSEGEAKELFWDIVYNYFGLDSEEDTFEFATFSMKFKTPEEIRTAMAEPFNDLVKYIVSHE